MKTNILIFIIMLFSLISGAIGSHMYQNISLSSGGDTTMSDIENKIIHIAERSSNSVANIVIKKDLTLYRSDPWGFFQTPIGSVEKKVGGGTAFFITKDGLMITNKHVIQDKNANYTVITKDRKEHDAKVIAVHPTTDLAFIQVISNETFTPLQFVSDIENDIKVGQFAIAIGYALAEFENSVSFGVISGKNRSINASGIKLEGVLQTDAAINPGNSGGPLVNLDGKVIGINTAIVERSQGIGFSIPLSQKIIDHLLQSLQN